MSLLDKIIDNMPEVQAPKQKKLGFKTKLKWTLMILTIFFVLGLIPLFGLGANALGQFEFLSIVLGASFGSIISLGIGPIVTASIVLQLLNGSGLIKFDLSSDEGRRRFQGVQKLMSVGFIILEAFIYVRMGGLSPIAGIPMWILIIQLFLGGLLIMFMDEVISKWGFGSGISLFIAAGVSQTIFIRIFNPLASPNNPGVAAGALPQLFQQLASGNPVGAAIQFSFITSTIIVFLIVVFTQAMKVELPLSFGRIRGQGVKWPLNFFYTSNIPVILVAALLANLQLLSNFFPSMTFLQDFTRAPNLLKQLITGSLSVANIWHALIYLLLFVGGSIIFGIFWVQTAGLDAKSQAQKIRESGLQIPGFRKDQRVLERMLERYIWPLTIMGSIAVGLLAALADLTGAFGSGTGILLTVMIIYQLYQEIAQQHMMDMNPAMRKFIVGK